MRLTEKERHSDVITDLLRPGFALSLFQECCHCNMKPDFVQIWYIHAIQYFLQKCKIVENYVSVNSKPDHPPGQNPRAKKSSKPHPPGL